MTLRRLAKERAGQGLVEYALLLTLVALAVIAAAAMLGQQTSRTVQGAQTVLGGQVAAPCLSPGAGGANPSQGGASPGQCRNGASGQAGGTRP